MILCIFMFFDKICVKMTRMMHKYYYSFCASRTVARYSIITFNHRNKLFSNITHNELEDKLLMNKYEIRTHKKKTAIIHAALELFKEHGFTNSSIKQIASMAHVSQVSIYNYFGSKDALVFECVKLISNDIITKAYELLYSDMDYKEKLFAGLTLCTGKITLSMNEYFSASSLTDVNFVNLLNTYIQNVLNEIFTEYIEAGKKEGIISSTIPTTTILNFFSAFHSIELDSENLNQDIQDIHHLFLYGIIGK